MLTQVNQHRQGKKRRIMKWPTFHKLHTTASLVYSELLKSHGQHEFRPCHSGSKYYHIITWDYEFAILHKLEKIILLGNVVEIKKIRAYESRSQDHPRKMTYKV